MPRTFMQKTSLEAFFGEILPNLGEKQRAVLDIFCENPTMTFTNTELSEELGWSINRVTPRVYELRGRGKNNALRHNPVLVETERRMCRVTGRKCIAWQVNPDRDLRRS